MTKRVHFLIDEAASLGRMPVIDDALNIGRGYGALLTLIYQSMGSLKKNYPDGQDQVVLSNVSQVFFAVNDQMTAEYVSARCGEFTNVVASGGTSHGTSRQVPNIQTGHNGGSRTYSFNENDNWSLQARKILKPEEVTALPPNQVITFTAWVPPVMTTLVQYFAEPSLGRPPSKWQRFKLAAWTVYASVFLLFAWTLSAIALAMGDVAHHPLFPSRPSPQATEYEQPPATRRPLPKQPVRRSVSNPSPNVKGR